MCFNTIVYSLKLKGEILIYSCSENGFLGEKVLLFIDMLVYRGSVLLKFKVVVFKVYKVLLIIFLIGGSVFQL